MKQPTERELDALAPLPLIHAIHDGLRGYEGTRLDKPRSCPHCGEIDYHKHDSRSRRFAVLITEDGFENVTVSVQRYWCKQCKKPVDADLSELFYDDCLYGKPIVDLYLYHAAENPLNRIERILHTYYGIQVDWDTIQRYAELFADRVGDRHGSQVSGMCIKSGRASVNYIDGEEKKIVGASQTHPPKTLTVHSLSIPPRKSRSWVQIPLTGRRSTSAERLRHGHLPRLARICTTISRK